MGKKDYEDFKNVTGLVSRSDFSLFLHCSQIDTDGSPNVRAAIDFLSTVASGRFSAKIKF